MVNSIRDAIVNRIDPTTLGAVTSVFGRTGNVIADPADYASYYIKLDGTSIPLVTIPFYGGTNTTGSIAVDGLSTAGALVNISFRDGLTEYATMGKTAGIFGSLSPGGFFFAESVANYILGLAGSILYNSPGGTHTFNGAISATNAVTANASVYFPINQGDYYGSATTPTAAITGDGTDLVLNSRVSGTGAVNITYNLKVSPVQDVYSQFGAAANIFTGQADSTDRLVVTKSESSTSGTIRAGVSVSEFTGGSSSTANFYGLTGITGTSSASTANLTQTSNGGIVGLRGQVIHNGSGTISQAGAVSAMLSGGNSSPITDAFGFISEGIAPGASATWTRTGGLWIKTPTKGGLVYGIRVDTLATGSVGTMQVALGGTGAGTGIYYGATTAIGAERTYSSASQTMDVEGRATVNLRVNASVLVAVTSTSTTLSNTLILRTGGTAAGSEPIKFTSASLLTTATAGTLEFLTDKYYATISTGAARKELTLNDTALTSGRVPIVTTNGRLTDDADLTFSVDTLTATKIVGSTSVKAGSVGGFISSDGSTGLTATITTAALTPGGTQGSMTFKDGILTAQTQAT